MMACHVIRACRCVLEECLKFASQRIVFGKPLIQQPVIRAKLAKMIGICESSQSMESISILDCSIPLISM